MIEQKRSLLQKLEQENKLGLVKKESIQKTILEAKSDLSKIQKKMEESKELQVQDG